MIFLWLLLGCEAEKTDFSHPDFKRAFENSKAANQALRNASAYMQGWLSKADEESGLIPRNLFDDKDIWNAKDAAADNYPFMVLTAAITDSVIYNTTMQDMLTTEIELTSRLNSLPDTYSFIKNDFLLSDIDTSQIIFGASEYMKDGLLPLTEWLGTSPWSERMLAILRNLYPLRKKIERVVGENLGKAPVEEVKGELLQVLNRMYWMTGEEQFYEWAIEIGDHYLLKDNLPRQYIRLRDHGCEFISGLSELYFTVSYKDPERKNRYQQQLHNFLNEILAYGRNEDGMFYNAIDLEKQVVLDSGLADTWGYTLNAYLTLYQIDHKESYKQAVEKTLANISKYTNYPWEGESSDGYADAIESAINLHNRLPQPSVANWIDSEIKVMWQKQQPNGIIEGWHGDGNFARTSIMYQLWKTKGVTVHPWRANLYYAAKNQGDTLRVTITSPVNYTGHLFLDKPRHQVYLNIPEDYPRINQFQEWFTVSPSEKLQVINNQNKKTLKYNGSNKIPISLLGGDSLKIVITKL